MFSSSKAKALGESDTQAPEPMQASRSIFTVYPTGIRVLIAEAHMSFEWIHEQSPRWDGDKARIVGGAPPGVFDLGSFRPTDPVPGEWWRAEEDGVVVAYGWMDTVWGDAEMLLAVDPAHAGRGVGTFVLDQLDREAADRGLNYLFNVVRPSHPERDRVTAWLQRRGFEPASDGLLRRRVRQARVPSARG